VFLNNQKIDTKWLAKVSFFEGFDQEQLEAVSRLGERVTLKAGSLLIDQGRVGDRCYVIASGRAAVTIRGEFVTSVGPETMVGEMALVGHRPRSAAVHAETDMELVSFGNDDFRKLLEQSPETYQRVMELLARRLEENRQRDQSTSKE